MIFQAMTHFIEMCFFTKCFWESSKHSAFVMDCFCQWPTCIVLLFMRNAFVSHLRFLDFTQD